MKRVRPLSQKGGYRNAIYTSIFMSVLGVINLGLALIFGSTETEFTSGFIVLAGLVWLVVAAFHHERRTQLIAGGILATTSHNELDIKTEQRESKIRLEANGLKYQYKDHRGASYQAHVALGGDHESGRGWMEHIARGEPIHVRYEPSYSDQHVLATPSPVTKSYPANTRQLQIFSLFTSSVILLGELICMLSIGYSSNPSLMAQTVIGLIVGAIFAGLAFSGLANTYATWLRLRALRATAITTRARVTRVIELVIDKDVPSVFHLQYQYATQNGLTRRGWTEITMAESRNWRAKLSDGSVTVEVQYDPQHPEDHVVGDARTAKAESTTSPPIIVPLEL